MKTKPLTSEEQLTPEDWRIIAIASVNQSLEEDRDQAYTSLVEGIEKSKKPISKVQSILNKKGIDKKGVKKELAPMYPYNRALNDILENVVKPLYNKTGDN